jgi:predicted flap endonuclease-1-like 5' DNA nuclease
MELVKVKLSKGVYMKMEKSEAIKKGLYTEPPKQKMRQPAQNKMIVPKVHKLDSTPEPDDFTEIAGVGKATDQSLHDNGIHTLDQLMTCDLSFLSGKAKSVIESWRESL